ncbi:MAG: YitT family protein [Rhizobiaceae bacterium]
MIESGRSRHSLAEDGLALVTGTAFVALGLSIYMHARLMTGSSAGLALLAHYATGYPFEAMFFAINLPFYALAVLRMGWPFTVRTFIAVALISVFARLTPQWISFASVDPLYAALAGGGLQGIGLLILFRHRTGLGGFNILALWLQERFAIRAGWFQLGVDLLVLALSIPVIGWKAALLSVVGAAALNIILGINHRPGRYVGVS